MRRCCSCGQSFKPTGKGYRCLCCRRAYDAKWRAKRKESGDPVKSTKMPRAYHRAYEADYFRDPANRARRAKLAKTYRDDPARRHKHEARWAVQRAIRAAALIALYGDQVTVSEDDLERALQFLVDASNIVRTLLRERIKSDVLDGRL